MYAINKSFDILVKKIKKSAESNDLIENPYIHITKANYGLKWKSKNGSIAYTDK